MRQPITSSKNPLLRDLRQAVAHGRLTSDGFMVAEGPHLLEEALRSGLELRSVLVAASAASRVRLQAQLPVTVVEDRLFDQVCSTETSQGLIALVRPPSWSLDQLFGNQALVFVLDGIQDPGNAGAIVRAGEAFGATGVIFLKGAVSRYNPKTIRASAGSLFRLPVVHDAVAASVRTALEREGMTIFAAMPNGGTGLAEANLARPCAVVLGSEGHGVSDPLRRATVELRIPTVAVESLNVAMAAAVILYEARRQRALNQ